MRVFVRLERGLRKFKEIDTSGDEINTSWDEINTSWDEINTSWEKINTKWDERVKEALWGLWKFREV